MRKPTRARILAAILGPGLAILSSACGVDVTVPGDAAPASTPERESSFAPSAATKALVGVSDGVYRVTIDPKTDNVLALGANRIEIPANAICRLGASDYGPAFWDSSCTTQKAPVTLTVTITGAGSTSPMVDFQPAMRFHPQSRVSLYMYVPHVTRDDAKAWTILYCGSETHAGSDDRGRNTASGTATGCVDESVTDPDLRTFVDYEQSVLFRRIKHFSAYRVGGYVVSE